MRLYWTIAKRFSQRHDQSGFLSFMSSSSIIGIALGCFVLITLLSVMNGFERELKQKLLSVIPHAELFSIDYSGIKDWPALKTKIEKDERVDFVTPYTQITGLLQNKSTLSPVALSGLKYSDKEIAMFSTAVPQDYFKQLENTPNGVILGKTIADELGLSIGQNIDLLIPTKPTGVKLTAPKKVQFEVVGFLHLGGEVDGKLGLINLKQASSLLGIESGAQGIRISMHDPFQASTVVREYGFYLDQAVYMSDWTRTHGHIFQDIQLVRVVVYIVLTLVIAVACFNVVSTLVMSVKAKQASIAILMSMGATQAFILKVFLIQGLKNGLLGTFFGVVCALLLVPNLSLVVSKIESLIGSKLLSADVYFIDFLPTAMQPSDVLITSLIGIGLSVLSSYYPARRASRVLPAQALS